MLKNLTFYCICIFFFGSCTSEKTQPSITFKEIEKEFNFQKPLTEKSKTVILQKWGSTEVYRSHLLNVFEKKSINTKENSKLAPTYYNVYVNDKVNGDCYSERLSSERYILDQLYEEGHDLPYSCRSGACTSCLCVCYEGIVDQSEQSILDQSQLDRGLVVICVAYPRSDLSIVTGGESIY